MSVDVVTKTNESHHRIDHHDDAKAERQTLAGVSAVSA